MREKKNNNEDREKKPFVNDFLNVFAVLQFSDVFSYNFSEYKYHLNDADCEIYLWQSLFFHIFFSTSEISATSWSAICICECEPLSARYVENQLQNNSS